MSRPREPLPTRFQDVPELPPAAVAALDEGLASLGLEIPAAVRDALIGHLRLLLAWTPSINLTAIRDPVGAVTLHILDSLTAVPILRDQGVRRLLDIGSGGGYPGLPLAIVVPAQALLVESIGKKARFLEVAIEALGLGTAPSGSPAAHPGLDAAAPSVTVARARAETLGRDPRHRGGWPLVTARAVADLADVVELAFPLLEPGGRLVAWKRAPLDDELRAARRAAAELGGGGVSTEPVPLASLPGHVLVIAQKRRDTPGVYPRDPTVRQRRPWRSTAC